MRLPINIEELLGGRAVEGDRIEYKTGWNPDAIYRSVCAFANDFDETGGGYIVVGVKEINGRPVRPVIGIDPNQIEPIETDEERTYFLIDIPCHPEFVKETLSVEQIGVKGGVKEPNVTKDVTKNVTKDVTKELTERQSVILEMITEDSFVTIPEMSLKTGVATRTIKRDIENLQSSGILTRKGGRKDGEWIVTELGMAMLEALKK